MTERIELRRVTADGTPGDRVASAILDGDRVTYEGATAEQTFQMLARRNRRTEAEMFALVRDQGWSNGWLMAVNPTPK